MPTSWTNNPATGDTPIRAVHINELRAAVDSNRSGAGLTSYPWTDRPVVAGVTRIRAVHMVELRAAIQELWSSKQLGRLHSWTGGTLPARNRPIRASHVNDLRAWVNAYENSSARPVDPQGVVSFSYQPALRVQDLDGSWSIDGPYVVRRAWCKDASDLKTTGQVALRIRTLVQSRNTTEGDNAIDSQVARYVEAFNEWQAAWQAEKETAADVGIVLPAQFHRAETLGSFPHWCPNRYLEVQGDGGPAANPYILSFAARAAGFVAAVASAGVKTVWIWNEPNLVSNSIDTNQFCESRSMWRDSARNSLGPEAFASLTQRTARAIKDALGALSISDIKVYCGSLSVLKPFDPTGSNVAGYVRRMYAFLNNGVEDPESPFPYAWDGMSLNLNGENVDAAWIDRVYDALKEERVDRGRDTTELIVGEWGSGFTNESDQVSRQAAQGIFDAIRSKFITMYFYSHFRDKEIDPLTGSSTTFGCRDYYPEQPPGATIANYAPVAGSVGELAWYGHLQYLYTLPGVD